MKKIIFIILGVVFIAALAGSYYWGYYQGDHYANGVEYCAQTYMPGITSFDTASSVMNAWMGYNQSQAAIWNNLNDQRTTLLTELNSCRKNK